MPPARCRISTRSVRWARNLKASHVKVRCSTLGQGLQDNGFICRAGHGACGVGASKPLRLIRHRAVSGPTSPEPVHCIAGSDGRGGCVLHQPGGARRLRRRRRRRLLGHGWRQPRRVPQVSLCYQNERVICRSCSYTCPTPCHGTSKQAGCMWMNTGLTVPLCSSRLSFQLRHQHGL